MINIQNLAMNFGQRQLFSQVSLELNLGMRYGLVGANGAGKTTLLKILAGQEQPAAGEITKPRDCQIGLLQQDHFRYENMRIMDVVIQGKSALWDAMQEKAELLDLENLDVAAGYRLGELEEVISHEGGYTAEAVAGEILTGLGIPNKQHQNPLKSLSGGFKLRVLLARLLFQSPDFMLLDEPTNHLDIVSIQWLQEYLKSTFTGCLVFISHDQQFLNATSTHVLDLDYATVTQYVGNYDQHCQTKAMMAEQDLKTRENQQRKIASLQTFVDKFGAKATKAKQAKSKQKQIDRIQLQEIQKTSRIKPRFAFQQATNPGKDILQIEELDKAFGAHKVLSGINLHLRRGEKIAIIGANGLGKSTLLKIILAQLESSAGHYQWGHGVHYSYFAQDHHEQLRGEDTVLRWASQFAGQAAESEVRGVLGRALLSGNDVKKPISKLSGGEGARLLLAKMMLEKANVLILDEPTNHMDLEGIEALAEALTAFPGTVIAVSHDRFFVGQFAKRLLELTPEGAIDHDYNYATYLARANEDYFNQAKVISSEKPPQKAKVTPSKQRATQKKLEAIQRQITAQEKKIADIDNQFAAPDFYQEQPTNAITKLQTERANHQARLDELMVEWEALMTDGCD